MKNKANVSHVTGIKDDSHKRWANQPNSDTTIWNYYNDVVAKRVVNESIHKKDITLVDLYQKLALKRAECEWMKQHATNNHIENITPGMIEDISKNSIFSSFPEHFANFQAGKSREPNILSVWGDTVSKLVVKRQDINFTGTFGLSVTYRGRGNDIDYDLHHPQGYVLTLLEHDFQTMRNTTNLFEFVKSASRLMYMLSNYPPIERGNAAVSSWIVDKIAQEKFDLTTSIRPFLYDWIAFFDTPEQYTQYFVMATTVNYLKSLHKVAGIDEFETKLLELMQENPHVLKNAEEREALWNELKNIILQANEKDFSESEMKHLHDITAGNLQFRKPTKNLEPIIEIVSKYEVSEAITRLSPTDKEYLIQMFSLDFNLGQAYVSQFGTLDEENFHVLVTDLLFLQCNDIKEKIDALSFELLRTGKLNPLLDHYSQKTKEFERIHNDIMQNPIVKWGFISIDSMHLFSNLIQITKGQEEKVARSLKNGLSIHALNTFINNHAVTSKDIELLTSNAAILLYKADPFISIEPLIRKTSKETEMNILRLVAKQYCNEPLKEITNENIRLCLLNLLDPNLFKYVTLSELVGKTELETKIKLLSAYLNYEMPNLDNIKNIIVTLQEDIAKQNHIFNLKDSYGFFSKKAGKQIIPHEFNLANIEFEIEMEGNSQELNRDMAQHVKMLIAYCDDAYELLGVNQDASDAQITKAFYKMARIHHPDKNVNADKEFMQYLIIAHKVLTDPAGRQTYDEALSFKNKREFK